MKRKKLLYVLVALPFYLCFNGKTAYSQTDGTLTFTYTQNVPAGTSATKNVLAVWIEDNAGTFVKTKLRRWGGGTSDHLPTVCWICGRTIG